MLRTILRAKSLQCALIRGSQYTTAVTEELKKSKTNIGINEYNNLLRTYLSSNKFSKFEETIRKIKLDNVLMNDKTYEELINYYLKINKLDKIEEILKNEEHIKINPKTYLEISKKLEKINESFEKDILELNILGNEEIFLELIYFYFKKKEYQKIEENISSKIISQIKIEENEEARERLIKLLNSVLVNYSKIGKIEEIKKIEEEIEKINEGKEMSEERMKSAGILLSTLAKQDKKAELEIFYEKLKEKSKKIDKNIKIKTILIHYYGKNNDYRKMNEILREIEEKEEEMDEYLLNTLIWAFIKSNNVSKFNFYIEKMKKQNIEFNYLTYHAIIYYYGQCRLFPLMQFYFDHFLNSLHQKSAKIRSLPSGTVGNPEIMEIKDVLKQEGDSESWENLSGFHAQEKSSAIFIFNRVLHFYSKNQEFNKVDEIYSLLKKYSISPDSFTFEILLKSIPARSKPSSQSPVPSSGFISSQITETAKGKARAAEDIHLIKEKKIFSELNQIKIPQQEAFDINGYCDFLFDEMVKYNIKANENLFSYFIFYSIQSRHTNKIFEYYLKFSQNPFQVSPTLHIFTLLINYFASIKAKSIVLYLKEQLNLYGISAPDSLLNKIKSVADGTSSASSDFTNSPSSLPGFLFNFTPNSLLSSGKNTSSTFTTNFSSGSSAAEKKATAGTENAELQKHSAATSASPDQEDALDKILKHFSSNLPQNSTGINYDNLISQLNSFQLIPNNFSNEQFLFSSDNRCQISSTIPQKSNNQQETHEPSSEAGFQSEIELNSLDDEGKSIKKENKIFSETIEFNSTLNQLGSNGKFEEMLNLFYTNLKKQRKCIDQLTFLILFKNLTKNKKNLQMLPEIKKLEKVMGELGIEKNIEIYHCLLLIHSGMMNLISFHEILNALFSEKLFNQLTIRTYEILFRIFHNLHLTSEIDKLYTILVKFSKLKLNSNIYSTLIQHYGATKNFDKMNRLFEDMQLEGIPPHCFLYNNMIEAYLSEGDVDSAEDLLWELEMNEIFIPPSLRSKIKKSIFTAKNQQL